MDWSPRYGFPDAEIVYAALAALSFGIDSISDSSRAGAQRSAMKGKLEISVLSLTPELR